jgi:hypothetical protein
MTDGRTAEQLAIIGEIRDLFASAGVDWWLFGGWAVDFHCGEVTRDHHDIEFYIREADAAVVRDVLAGRGYVQEEIPFPEEAVEFRKGGHLVCAVLLARSDSGAIVMPGRWTHWPWPEGAFDGPPARIGALEAPVVTAQALLDRMLAYAAHAPGAPPLRPRDEDAVARLRAVIARESVEDW